MGRKKKTKIYERKGLIPKKRKGGIWITNKFGKVKSKRLHPPRPITKRCGKCGARVLYHHYLCQLCWNKKNGKIKT